MKMSINIDKMIDNHKCPAAYICAIATTDMESVEREHSCYLCWREYCRENNIEISYEHE